MVARFRQMPQRPAIDRQEMMRRAMQAMQARRQTAAPARGGSPIADRVGGMRGAQGAVDFGAAMTGQNSGLQQALESIRSRVGQGLASKGIYQDQGGYHIQGLPQAPDTGIAMRDAAVQAMGGDPWTKIVQEADARLRAGNLPIPRTAGVNAPTPQPGLGGVPTPAPRPTTTNTTTPPTVTGGRPSAAPLPQPGLGGVPPVRTAAPAPTGGTVPQPGLGGVPQVSGRPGNVTPFPPQGQGVGRTTTPTGNQVDPAKYPVTGGSVPQPGLGGVPSSPGLQTRQLSNGASVIREPSGGGIFIFPDGSQGIIPADGSPPRSIPASGTTKPTGGIYSTPGGQVPQPGLGGVPPTTTTPYVGPSFTNTSTVGGPPRSQGTFPSGDSRSAPTPAMPADVMGYARPGAMSMTPAAPGRPSTPTVAPGSLPGNTTPARPGQAPTTFGSPGPSAIPNGTQMAQDIISRVQGVRSQNPVVGQQQTGLASLAGLGDRIRASVQRGVSGTNGMPGVGTSDLGGGLGASIAASVRQQLDQGGLGRTPTLGAPATGQGIVPGGTTPGGTPPSAAPAPGPTSAMPTGTGSLGTMGGRYAPLDQYNAAFEAAGKEFGVPPELLKAMAGIESGWTGDPSVCRPDDGYGGGPACGMMQVKGQLHQEAGCTNQNDPVCNIRTAAAILKGGYDACGNWDCAITSVYFTADDPNGTTQGMYLEAVHQSMQEQAGNPGTGQVAGPPTTGTQVLPTNAPQQIDPATGAPIQATPVTGANGGVANPATEIGAPPAGVPGSESVARPPVASGAVDTEYTPTSGISTAVAGSDETYMVNQAGGAAAPISSEFGGPVLNPDWYVYQEAMGGSRYEHDAYDIAYPRGTPISGTGLLQGTVQCVGCDGSYGTGYVGPDGGLVSDGVGVGQIQVAIDPSLQGGQQITMLYGHMLTSSVEAGQAVTEGTQIGTTGYAGSGDHLHEEARAYCPGQGYANDQRLVDPTLVADGWYQTHNACTDQPL